ncbi:hypothetical protein [Amycolatopsis sp. NPDC051716]|uniref:hypothetical protein n=1 Tax=Amycolatopsis sp. NPDC051716 TaxID=3155804 RepID=UPI00344A5D01
MSEDVWTEERIRALGVRMDAVDAVRAVHGCGKTRAYEALRGGEDLGFRVLKLGRRYVTPTADVLRALGLEQQPAPFAAVRPLRGEPGAA